MEFKKAERKKIPLKIGLMGPSGSGKTYSSLLLAQGLVGKDGRIAVIDTENGSAELYSHLLSYDVVRLEHPQTVEKYKDAILLAEREGYDVCIVDTISHEWNQLLDEKGVIDANSKTQNTYFSWNKITPKHREFWDAILQTDMHIIATLRTKDDYVLEVISGKQVPRKIGLAPVQREGSEYEFTLLFSLAHDHTTTISKDRTAIFHEQNTSFIISAETGKKIADWLSALIPAPQNAPQLPVVNEKQRDNSIIPTEKSTKKNVVYTSRDDLFSLISDLTKYLEIPKEIAKAKAEDILKKKFKDLHECSDTDLQMIAGAFEYELKEKAKTEVKK